MNLLYSAVGTATATHASLAGSLGATEDIEEDKI
jgi:hypothetical protein